VTSGATPLDYAAWRASSLGSITERLERAAVLDLVGEPATVDVLDVGAGDGAYAIALARKGAWATALDPSAAALRAARRAARDCGERLRLVRGGRAGAAVRGRRLRRRRRCDGALLHPRARPRGLRDRTRASTGGTARHRRTGPLERMGGVAARESAVQTLDLAPHPILDSSRPEAPGGTRGTRPRSDSRSGVPPAPHVGCGRPRAGRSLAWTRHHGWGCVRGASSGEAGRDPPGRDGAGRAPS